MCSRLREQLCFDLAAPARRHLKCRVYPRANLFYAGAFDRVKPMQRIGLPSLLCRTIADRNAGVGHFGIFVSGKAAKKERAQFVLALESIEAREARCRKKSFAQICTARRNLARRDSPAAVQWVSPV
jgi:hypothetical protein